MAEQQIPRIYLKIHPEWVNELPGLKTDLYYYTEPSDEAQPIHHEVIILSLPDLIGPTPQVSIGNDHEPLRVQLSRRMTTIEVSWARLLGLAEIVLAFDQDKFWTKEEVRALLGEQVILPD